MNSRYNLGDVTNELLDAHNQLLVSGKNLVEQRLTARIRSTLSEATGQLLSYFKRSFKVKKMDTHDCCCVVDWGIGDQIGRTRAQRFWWCRFLNAEISDREETLFQLK